MRLPNHLNRPMRLTCSTLFAAACCGTISMSQVANGEGGDTPEAGVIEVITGEPLPYLDEGDTCDNSNFADEPCPDTSLSPDVWYEWSPEVDGSYLLSACNADYDTKVYVYDAATSDLVGCNDDGCNGTRSRLVLELSAVSTYQIAIDGSNDECGTYLFQIRQAPCSLSCPDGATIEVEPDCEDGYIDVTNGGCNSFPRAFGEVACGETICGRTGVYVFEGDDARDTDWFVLELDEPRQITVDAVAQAPTLVAIITENDDLGDCALGFISVNGEACEEVSLTNEDAEAGIYYIYIAPAISAFGDPAYICGLDYHLTVSCSEVPQFEETCSAQAVFGQTPDNPENEWTLGTSDLGPGLFLRAESYTAEQDICALTWWGSTAFNDPEFGWGPCTEEPMGLEISFWTDDGGAPGTVQCSYDVSVTPEDTGFTYDIFPILRYSVELPECCTLQSGWVSIQGTSVQSPDCWFLWAGSSDGNGSSFYLQDGVETPYPHDLAVCLIPAESECPEDINGDGMVDVGDLLALLGAWGTGGGPADIDGDGDVDVEDLLALLGAWGATC